MKRIIAIEVEDDIGARFSVEGIEISHDSMDSFDIDNSMGSHIKYFRSHDPCIELKLRIYSRINMYNLNLSDIIHEWT